MKRRELVSRLEDGGLWLKRHGAEHDIYGNGEKSIPVPRHREISDRLAKKILRDAGLL